MTPISAINMFLAQVKLIYFKYIEYNWILYFFFKTEMSQVFETCRKTSNISRTSVGNIIVDNSDVVGASPVGAAPTTSSFST